jgi:hypothetical protein
LTAAIRIVERKMPRLRIVIYLLINASSCVKEFLAESYFASDGGRTVHPNWEQCDGLAEILKRKLSIFLSAFSEMDLSESIENLRLLFAGTG